MILSFHPCFEADHNLICAGRDPGPDDLAAICAAKAVILPQGCNSKLYGMARENCAHVFPCWDMRFDYPGKIGQINLFKKFQIPHPQTFPYENLSDFHHKYSNTSSVAFTEFPFVLKFDWGGEGDGVFPIYSKEELDIVLQKVATFEANNHKGFLIQEFIPCGNRSLRVVVIGDLFISYWRVQAKSDEFFTHVSKGAVIDHDSDPDLQFAGRIEVENLCRRSGINLAGFDIIFSEKPNMHSCIPLFLEINYFFGRNGLGGSEKYYKLLIEQIEKWLEKLKI